MGRVPCEYIPWFGLPVIRKELAKCMIDNFGLNQRETAGKLGITAAAVCQYLSKKRGKVKIIDEKILVEINKSAERIIKHKEVVDANEICRLCKILRSEGMFKFYIEK